MPHPKFLAAEPGTRVRFNTPDGVKEGVVVREEDSELPWHVVVETDDGKEYRIPVGIGWPKAK